MKALITRASSGIGRELSIKLYKEGYDIIIHRRNEKNLNDLSNYLLSMDIHHKGKIKILKSDLSNIENCYNIFEENKDVDLIINNAGFGDLGYFDETALDKEISMINTNILSCHILTKLYLKEMIKKDQGIILNVASIAGFVPGPLMATYYATKNYVVKLSQAIKYELKKKKSNVQISLLCPGPVDTNFFENANAQFTMKPLSAEYVARYTIEKLNKKKFYIIPGFSNKIIKILSKFVPCNILNYFIFKIQKSKKV